MVKRYAPSSCWFWVDRVGGSCATLAKESSRGSGPAHIDAESGFSQRNRRLGWAPTTRRVDARARELAPRALTHSLLLLAAAT